MLFVNGSATPVQAHALAGKAPYQQDSRILVGWTLHLNCNDSMILVH